MMYAHAIDVIGTHGMAATKGKPKKNWLEFRTATGDPY